MAVEVYPGRTADPSTLADQVEKLRGRFGLQRVVIVGDRGLLTQTQIESLRQYPGVGWISALRFESIRQLAEEGSLQPSLFDQRHLAEPLQVTLFARLVVPDRELLALGARVLLGPDRDVLAILADHARSAVRVVEPR